MYAPLADGTGMLGLPGDYTLPWRFVRATAFANSILPSKDAEEGIYSAFYILNAFDIPKGLVRAKTPRNVLTDYTIWISAVDTQHSIYYFKTYKNQTIRKVVLKTLLKDAICYVKEVFSETKRRYEYEFK